MVQDARIHPMGHEPMGHWAFSMGWGISPGFWGVGAPVGREFPFPGVGVTMCLRAGDPLEMILFELHKD